MYPVRCERGKLFNLESLDDTFAQLVLDALSKFMIYAAIGLPILIVEDTR